MNARIKNIFSVPLSSRMYPAGNQVGEIYKQYRRVGNKSERIYIREKDFQEFYNLIRQVNRNPQNEELIGQRNRLIEHLHNEFLKAEKNDTFVAEHFVERVFVPMPIQYEDDNSGEEGGKLLENCLMLRNAEPANYNLERFEQLLKTGADPNHIVIPDNNVRLIHMAVQQPDNIKYIKKLIEYEADVNVKNNQGWTPLHYAVHKDKASLITHEDRNKYVEWLADAGAKTNEYNSDGKTPLHVAITNGANLNISPLLRNGADINAPVGRTWLHRLFGATPLRLAHLCRNEKAISALKGRGANRWFGVVGWRIIKYSLASIPLPPLAWWFGLIGLDWVNILGTYLP